MNVIDKRFDDRFIFSTKVQEYVNDCKDYNGYIPVCYLLRETDIDRATIKLWCEKGYIKFIKKNSKYKIYVNIKSFIYYVLNRSRYKKFKGIQGKRWTIEEKMNIQNTTRSKEAKKIMKCRLGKM